MAKQFWILIFCAFFAAFIDAHELGKVNQLFDELSDGFGEFDDGSTNFAAPADRGIVLKQVKRISEQNPNAGVVRNLNHGGFAQLETVRQCSCKEVEKCFHQIWSNSSCSYRGGSSSSHVEGRPVEILDQCSTTEIQPYCTPDHENSKFITISDYGFIETKNMEKYDETLCFNQQIIQCFQAEGCDIVSHNVILKKIHFKCQKEVAQKMIQMMEKHAELVTEAQISRAKMEYFKKYNETLPSVFNKSPGNFILNLFTLACFFATSLIFFVHA